MSETEIIAEIVELGNKIVKKNDEITNIAKKYGYNINIYPIGGLGFEGSLERAKPEIGSKDFFDTKEEMRIPIFLIRKTDDDIEDEWDFASYPGNAEIIYEEYDKDITDSEYEKKEKHLLSFFNEIEQKLKLVYPEEYI